MQNKYQNTIQQWSRYTVTVEDGVRLISTMSILASYNNITVQGVERNSACWTVQYICHTEQYAVLYKSFHIHTLNLWTVWFMVINSTIQSDQNKHLEVWSRGRERGFRFIITGGCFLSRNEYKVFTGFLF